MSIYIQESSDTRLKATNAGACVKSCLSEKKERKEKSPCIPLILW